MESESGHETDENGDPPPKDYEPQVEIAPQQPGVYENPGDLVTEADEQDQNQADSADNGDAEGDDDEVIADD